MKPQPQSRKTSKGERGKGGSAKEVGQPGSRKQSTPAQFSSLGAKYKLQDLVDIEQFQGLPDRLNEIHSFPSTKIDNDGNILTGTAWQDGSANALRCCGKTTRGPG